MSIHDGHRQRIKKQYRDHGLLNFEDHSALELLLFYAMPRSDVNPLAHRLIDRFGSLNAVFDVPVGELMKVSGVGENTALLIKLVVDINRQLMVSRGRNCKIIDSTEKAGAYIAPFFHGERDEVVYMICLDAKFKVLNCKLMSRGSVNTANIVVRKIVENALANNSMSVILAHNHISGVALPSHEDKESTKRICEALQAVDIVLADHIIVADDDFVSMADNGFF